MRRTLAATLLALALLAAGCGGGGGGPEPTTTGAPTTTRAAGTTLRIYRVRAGRLAAESVAAPATPAVGAAALAALGYGSATLATVDGVARVGGLPEALARERLAELVYTLTQFPTIRAVEVAGTRLTRADFEELAPPILIETPTPGQTVRSPLRIAGTANTFEATFLLVLERPDGTRLTSPQVVTATSGSGERGTFETTLASAARGPVVLVGYEASAEDGRPIHRVEVPLTLAG